MTSGLVGLIVLIVLMAVYYESKKKKLISGFGPQLRAEFPDYADEITDELASRFVEKSLSYVEQHKNISEKLRKLRSSWFARRNGEEEQLLERSLTQLEADADRETLAVWPPRFREYLARLPRVEMESRMARVSKALKLTAK